MEQGLVDLVYESAFAPELWPKVLDGLALAAEARGGVLFVANPAIGLMRWTASPSFQEIFQRFVAEGWAQRDPRMGRILARHHPGFLTDDDLFGPGELETDAVSVSFKRPHGLGYGSGMAAPLPTGDIVGIGVERGLDRGPVERMFIERLDALRPHLARSAFISARLQLERARAAAEVLTVLGLPALLFSANGKVIAANALIEAQTDIVQWTARDRVALADASADVLFRAALSTFEMEAPATPRSFAVRGAEANAALVAHLVPIRGTARDIFSRCAGVLVLTPATAPQAPPVELIQSLFDLTPAEARVARGLAAGDTLDDMAVAGGVSRNTIRSQLRGALEKTQSQVVAKLPQRR
jgi:DNA-binding CsgD family transcriptional regulator